MLSLFRPGDLAMGGGGGYHEISGGAVIPLNTWTHIATPYNETTFRVYRNGNEVATLSYSGTLDTSGSPLRIGENSIWSEWWQGQIDEVRVSVHALTATEINTAKNSTLVVLPTAPTIPSATPAKGAAVRSLSQIDVLFKRGSRRGKGVRFTRRRTTRDRAHFARWKCVALLVSCAAERLGVGDICSGTRHRRYRDSAGRVCWRIVVLHPGSKCAASAHPDQRNRRSRNAWGTRG